MTWRNLIPKLNRLGTGTFPRLMNLINESIKNNDTALLRELNRLFNDVEYTITQAKKHARMGITRGF